MIRASSVLWGRSFFFRSIVDQQKLANTHVGWLNVTQMSFFCLDGLDVGRPGVYARKVPS